jgi:hypothetical protein
MRWGPTAWKLLHGIGYKTGKGQEKLRKDEVREVYWLLTHLEYIIPCEVCRKHIVEYRKGGIPTDVDQIGAWIWTFHEAVNERLGKSEGPPFTKELGKDINLKETWKEYSELVKKDLLLGMLNRDLLAQWSRHFHLWMSFI